METLNQIELWGITGQTGAGKSTVVEYYKSQGIICIDADKIARIVTEAGKPCLSELEKAFGAILSPDGSLNRRALANIVFHDKNKLKQLDDIIYPYITFQLFQELQAIPKGKTVLLDAPTLFESGLNKICKKIIAVTAEESLRCARIMKRDQITKEHALARMQSQLSQEFFITHSDIQIANNGSERTLLDTLNEWNLLNEKGKRNV